ncbi:MAG: C25 family cysteine peptidase [Thermoplasmatota archaeon]
MRDFIKTGIAVAVIMLLLGSGIAGMAGQMSFSGQTRDASMAQSMSFSIQPTTPYIERTSDEYVSVRLDGASAVTMQEGEPMLPYITKTMTFPLGTRIQDVEVTLGPVETQQLDVPVAPAPRPLPRNMQYTEPVQQKGPIYDRGDLYPAQWLRWHTGAGLHDGEHVMFLTVQAFPERYAPQANELHCVDSIEVTVTYEEPATSMLTADAYDLVIIAPAEFTGQLEPLVQHKEDHGLATKLVTLDEIYSGAYFSVQGRDGAEKIKYFIKDALEDWGITYVLLVGGKKSFLTGNWGYDGPTKVDDTLWHVPVRYAALDDNAENGYISDLYFADIYNGTGDFATWDTNDDGVYAAWAWRLGKDVIDGYPDVYVGRLACRSTREVETVVDKIITYETSTAGSEWFNRMLLIGGDTFPGDDYVDGEVTTEYSFGFMPETFDATKLFLTEGTLTLGGGESTLAGKFAWINVIQTMSNGFGFVAFDGHGSPTAWATHFSDPSNHDWINGLMTYNMDLLSNGDMLPVVTVGGCHNSEFNISLTDFAKNEWTYQPTYECWSWHLVKMRGGGSIATLGYTGLGYGATGDGDRDGIPDCIEYRGGFIEGKFYEAYGQDGQDMLGAAFASSITEYVNVFPPMDNQIDCKTIEEWTLLGDPSLKIGGY